MNMKDVPFVVGTVSHWGILLGVYHVLFLHSLIVLEWRAMPGESCYMTCCMLNAVYHVPLFNYKFLLYSTRLIQTVRIKLSIFQ